MTAIVFRGMPSDEAARYRAGAPDAYGMAPERRLSSGGAMPCRHCLDHIGEGEAYLTLAYRPFPALQPYAETGPIFLHAEACPPAAATADLPEILKTSPDYILRGYGADDRIVYGTGAVTAQADVTARAFELLSRPDIGYVHVRSSRNNCYQLRIERTD